VKLILWFSCSALEPWNRQGSIHRVGSATHAGWLLVVPDHAAIAKGTLRAIFNQASRFVPQVEYRAQRSADTSPHKARRYATAKLRVTYRNLQKNFGFFV
jgi:hypothetical protein